AEYATVIRTQPADLTSLRRYVRLLIAVGRTRQAADVLRAIVEKPQGTTREELAWIRRHLAVLSTAERSPDQIQQAFALLRHNDTEIGTNVEYTRAQIVLLSPQTPKPGEEPSPRRRAIELLEKLAQNTQGSGDDRFLLAKLYDADKAWDKADKSYRGAIA